MPVEKASLAASLELAPTDVLQHREYAEALLERIGCLPDGTAVALRGPWGRGKTDVMARVAAHAVGSGSDFAATVILNPWRYSRADLLTPLVARLIERLKRGQLVDWDRVIPMASGVVQLGIDLGLRTTGLDSSRGFAEGADTLKTITDGLFNHLKRKVSTEPYWACPDEDPGKGFREIVEVLLREQPQRRLLICIDDLDRCSPEKQVAFVECIHFLRSAQARAIFLVAIDSSLLCDAIRAHYNSKSFDPEAYLDKIFEYTQDLHPVVSASAQELLKFHLAQVPQGKQVSTLDTLTAEWFDNSNQFLSWFGACSGNLATPRNISRVCRRLAMLTRTKPPQTRWTGGATPLRCFWIWLAATQYWAATRPAFGRAAARLRRQLAATAPPSGTGRHDPNLSFPPVIADTFQQWPDLLTDLQRLHHEIVAENGYLDATQTWDGAFSAFAWYDSVFAQRGL